MIILGKSRVIAASIAFALASSMSLTAAAQSADKPAAPKPAAAAPAAKPAAAPKPNDAKGLFNAGEKKFKASDYAGALADFEASLAVKADPATQRYIALSHDNLQHFPEAVTAYEKFVAENPPKMKDQVEEATKQAPRS